MAPEPELRPDWAQRLRDERRAHGWDVTRLAQELRRAGAGDVSATAESLVRMIRDWEKGTYRPRERYRLLLARVLEVDLDQTSAPAPAIERSGPGRAGEVAASVRATSAHIVALDTRFGSRDLVEVAVRAAGHAHRTAHTRFTTDREVLAAAAEAQQIAGWVAFDAERQDLSRRMSLEALLSARSAGDRSMECFVLGQLAMQGTHLHRPVEAAQICAAVLEDGVKGSVRTMFTLRAARAAAQMGEHTRAHDLIGRTRSSYLDGPRDRDPAWAWWLTEAEISGHHAIIHADAGQWTHAIEQFAAACHLTTGWAGAAPIYQANLLWALAHTQAWDEAETVLVRDVLPHQGQVASVRAERTLARAGRLLEGARGRPSLREAARQLTTAP